MTSIVVTGFGATTPIGGDAASTWAAMLAGQVRRRTLEEDWAADLPVRIAAPAAVDPLDVLDRVEARRMDRSGQFALIAAREAWAHTGAPDIDKDPARRGRRVRASAGCSPRSPRTTRSARRGRGGCRRSRSPC